MKFRSLAAGAALCLCATPLFAQGTDTNTTRRDTTMRPAGAETGRMHERREGRAEERRERRRARARMRGTVAGLGRVEFLALQQQLRDDGCGVRHVTGRMDANTRTAIRRCMTKYNVTTRNVRALLDSMHIGFGPTDTPPSMATARGGVMAGGEMREERHETPRMERMERARERRMNRRGMRRGMMRDTTMMRGRMNMGDTTMMRHDTMPGMTPTMRDTMPMRHDSMPMGTTPPRPPGTTTP